MKFRYAILLIPIAYAIHLVEEAPRFVEWTHRYPLLFTAKFNTTMFIIGNTVFMLYVLVGTFMTFIDRGQPVYRVTENLSF